MPSPAKLMIGHYAFACSLLLAFVCGLEFFMFRNMQDAMTAQIQSADARIANLENATAKIVHRLNSVQVVPVVMSEAK